MNNQDSCTTPARVDAPAASKMLSPLQNQRTLLPGNQSARIKALACCKRIDHVEIRGSVKFNGSTHFIVQVFNKKSQSNIPTLQNRPDSVPAGEATVASAIPDALFYHRFSSFVNLRHEAYFHANTGHTSSRSCSYCTSMTQLLYDGPTLPRLHMKLFHGDASICHSLETFLNSILQLTNTLSTIPPARMCDGQHEIPLLLQKFLSVLNESKQPESPSPQSTQREVRTTKASLWAF